MFSLTPVKNEINTSGNVKFSLIFISYKDIFIIVIYNINVPLILIWIYKNIYQSQKVQVFLFFFIYLFQGCYIIIAGIQIYLH